MYFTAAGRNSCATQPGRHDRGRDTSGLEDIHAVIGKECIAAYDAFSRWLAISILISEAAASLLPVIGT